MTAPSLSVAAHQPVFRPLVAWLTAELATWIPATWRRDGDPGLLAVREDGRIRLLRRDGAPLDRAPRRGSRVVVRPGVKALHRRFSLPAAAAAHLRPIIANQIDHRTPWPVDQVWFGVAILGCNEDERLIDVRMTVTPRASVEAPLDAVRALNLRPTALEVEDGEGDWIALPLDDDAPSAARRARRWLPAVIPLALLAGLFAPPLLERAALTTALEESSRASAEVRRLAAALEDGKAASAYAERRKTETPSAAVVLEVLSRLLPDDVWLTEFHLDAGTALLIGQAADANRLPALLSSSPHFADVQFRSAVVREAAGGDRFQLSARVVPHAAP
jgi:general secretion pathway protein L